MKAQQSGTASDGSGAARWRLFLLLLALVSLLGAPAISLLFVDQSADSHCEPVTPSSGEPDACSPVKDLLGS